MITVKENFLYKSISSKKTDKLVNTTKLSVDIINRDNKRKYILFIFINVPKKIIKHKKLLCKNFKVMDSFVNSSGRGNYGEERLIIPSTRLLDSIKIILDTINSQYTEFNFDII